MDSPEVDHIIDELFGGQSRHRHINFKLIDPELSDLVIPDLLPPLADAQPRPAPEPFNGKFAHIPGFREALKEAFIHGRSQPRKIVVRGMQVSYGIEVEMSRINDADTPIVVKD